MAAQDMASLASCAMYLSPPWSPRAERPTDGPGTGDFNKVYPLAFDTLVARPRSNELVKTYGARSTPVVRPQNGVLVKSGKPGFWTNRLSSGNSAAHNRFGRGEPE